MSEPVKVTGRLLGARAAAVRPAGWQSLESEPAGLQPAVPPPLPEAELLAIRAAARSLRAAAAGLPRQLEERIDGLAGLVLDLGLAIAEQVLQTRIERGELKLLPILRRILAEVVEGGKSVRATAHVNAEDLAAFAEFLRGEQGDAGQDGLRFEVDTTLARGCLRVETSAGVWHYNPREVVARLREELKGAPL
jgi:hypothetical protein